MRWPRISPVLLLAWNDDYADIRERIRRDGRLDTEEVWLPASDDGWESFCARHRGAEVTCTWEELRERDKLAAERRDERDRAERERWRARARQRQAEADREWEAAKPQTARQVEAERALVAAQQVMVEQTLAAMRAATQRRQEAQAAALALAHQQRAQERRQSEREWQAKAGAQAYWSQRNPRYGGAVYHFFTVHQTVVIDGVELLAGHGYWLPEALVRGMTPTESAP
jgi:hypothetical protein